MKWTWSEQRAIRFLIIFFALYLGWTVLYELVIQPWGKLDQLVINSCSNFSAALLNLLGYSTFTSSRETIRTIGIDGTHGLWIGDPCNGITLFALFSSFIVAFPGSTKHKLWFIPLGIMLIHLMNVIRIAVLCIIVFYNTNWLDFNHTYFFQILMYIFIFSLWWLWMKYFKPEHKQA
jgi:exosortase family protein XrtF